jgi:hypothetical protein
MGLYLGIMDGGVDLTRLGVMDLGTEMCKLGVAVQTPRSGSIFLNLSKQMYL